VAVAPVSDGGTGGTRTLDPPCGSLAFKLGARSFKQVPQFADVQVECELSNDSSIRCVPEPGRTETQTETRQDHGTGSP
jgi:hypothetical protein